MHPDGHTVWVREDAVLIVDEAGQAPPLARLDARRHRAHQDAGGAPRSQDRSTEPWWSRSRRSSTSTSRTTNMSTTYVSPQIEAILGYNPQEYIDDPQLWENILHPDDREEAMATYLRGRESGGPFVFEYRLLARERQDGLVPRQRDRPHGRARPGGVHPGSDARHHRRQAGGGAHRVPRVSRQAHRAPEPNDVRRAPRSRARPGEAAQPRRGGRHGGPRRLQAGERLPRPRGGRRSCSCSSRRG